MTIDAWLTLVVLLLVLGGLVRGRWGADVVLLAGMLTLVVTGVLDTRTALAGFGNEGLMTIAALFVVAVGLQDTGASVAGVQRILGSTATVFGAQARIVLTSSVFSAFLNNTAVVATLLPVVHDWARRRRMAASKLLIPLSYATILGGTLTLIGTSTNLVVNGLIVAGGRPSLGVFDVTGVGVVVLGVGVVYLLTVGARLLPDRNAQVQDMFEAREYTAEMVVAEGSPLVGRTIEEAGLRHLQGAYLMEIHRGGQLLAAVGPQERLQADDQLVFVGIVESVVDLQKIQGLVPATNQLFKLEGPRHRRALVEAVVSGTCPIVGQTIRKGNFRLRYGAVVLAVSRNGQRIRQKIGDIVLDAGDTLLLEALPSFVEQQRHSRDFFLVSQVEGAAPPRHDRMGAALLILGGLVTASLLLGMPIFHAAVLAAAAMLLAGCTSGARARDAMDLRLLVAIAAAIGLGAAMERSGLAGFAAGQAVEWLGGNPWLSLLAVYLLTSFFTEVITNNAAAVLVFPVAEATAAGLGVDPLPYFVAVMFAASASFATPIGYQTNLMVYGPGGYRFGDFLRVGLPLNLLLALVTCLVLPLFFPFGG